MTRSTLEPKVKSVAGTRTFLSGGRPSNHDPTLCHFVISQWTCGSLNQHLIQMEAPPFPLSSRPKWRDLQFPEPSSDADGSTALPFVIPTEVEGSAVPRTIIRCGRKHRPPLCHPDRSGGICSSPNHHPMRTEAPPSPLSSRPKWRDLQFPEPSSDADGSTALPFVIPTEVEGSAVPRTIIRCGRKHRPPLCHPDRSGGICSSPKYHHPMRTEAPPFPLSSRPDPGFPAARCHQ